MVMLMTIEQVRLLRNILADLSKGMILAALAGPAITSALSLFLSLQALAIGLGFMYLAFLLAKREV